MTPTAPRWRLALDDTGQRHVILDGRCRTCAPYRYPCPVVGANR